MATTNRRELSEFELERVRAEWIERLTQLVETIEHWARELDWSTKRIEKRMEDSQLGKYVAPALLLQHETIRVLLDPIARSASGADGVVDLYLMPAYDDIASLYFHDGIWRLHYLLPGTPAVTTTRAAESQPLSKDVLHAVLEEMRSHAA
jgi:hypothetical protein